MGRDAEGVAPAGVNTTVVQYVSITDDGTTASFAETKSEIGRGPDLETAVARR
jgi:hypothetical protein